MPAHWDNISATTIKDLENTRNTPSRVHGVPGPHNSVTSREKECGPGALPFCGSKVGCLGVTGSLSVGNLREQELGCREGKAGSLKRSGMSVNQSFPETGTSWVGQSAFIYFSWQSVY